jgi:hypothetical protein
VCNSRCRGLANCADVTPLSNVDRVSPNVSDRGGTVALVRIYVAHRREVANRLIAINLNRFAIAAPIVTQHEFQLHILFPSCQQTRVPLREGNPVSTPRVWGDVRHLLHFVSVSCFYFFGKLDPKFWINATGTSLHEGYLE